HDQPGETGELRVHVTPVRIRPRKDKVAEGRHENEVARSRAESLVRNCYIAASRVLDLREIHAASLPPASASGHCYVENAAEAYAWLPSEIRVRGYNTLSERQQDMGGTGLEPVTPSLSSWCSPN